MAIKISGSTIIDDSRNIVAGVAATFTGNVTVGGTITYEDVTNIDSVGIVTARTGIKVLAGGIDVTGNSEFSAVVDVAGDLAIADTIRHIGDSNTKIRFPSVDTFAVETAGTERLRIDSNGRVGINKTPDASGGLVQFMYNEGYQSGASNLLTSASNAVLRLQTSNDSSKSLYFGGIDEHATPYLQVGNNNLTSGATATYSLILQPYGNNVGVGTVSPAQRFTSYAASGYPILANGPSNGIGLGGNGVIVFGTYDLGSYASGAIDASDFVIKTSGTERFKITSTGQLQATGAADVRLTLGSSGTAGTNDSVHVRADSANLKFMAASGGDSIFETNGTETLRILSGGGIGIGKSIYHLGDTNTWFGFADNDIFQLQTGGATRIYVDSAGTTWNRNDAAGLSTTTKLINSATNASGNGVSLAFAPTQNYGTRFSSIDVVQDGNNNMYMAFKVTDATQDPHAVERMRITRTGQLITNGSADPYSTRSATFQPAHTNTNNYISIIAGNTTSVSGITFGDAAGQSAGNYAGMFEYYHDGDYLTYKQNNSEKLRIDSSGNVGIGYTRASNFLAGANNLVVGSGNDDQGITIYSGQDAGDYGSIYFADGTSGDALSRGRIKYEHNNEVMSFYTNTLERLQIDIGGTTRLKRSTYNTGAVTVSNAALYLDIGTNEGAVNMHQLIGFGYRNVVTNAKPAYIGYQAQTWSGHTYGDLIFGTRSTTGGTDEATERLRITYEGKVGIGTDQTTSTLQIYGANDGEGTATGQLTLKDTAAYNASPTAGVVFQGHHASNNAQAIFAGIRGFKANANDSDYDGCLAFDVRKNGAVAYEAMRINEDGNVGIGTDNPGNFNAAADNLVVGTGNGHNGITINSAADADGWLVFNDAPNNTLSGAIQYNHVSNYMAFRTNGVATDRLHINSGGQVLVGTQTAPAYTNRRFTVADSTASGTCAVEIRGSASGDSRLYFTSSTTSGQTGAYAGKVLYDHANNYMAFHTNGSNERLRINSTGISTFYKDITLEDGGAVRFSVSHTSGGNVLVKNPTAANITFQTSSNSDQLQLHNGGKVGINTSVPQSDLQVITAGSSNQDGIFKIGGSDTTLGLKFDYDQSGSTVANITSNPAYTHSGALLKIRIDAAQNPNQLVLKGDGKIGIGTATPIATLHVQKANGEIARFGDITTSSFEGLFIKNDVSGYPAIENGDSNKTIAMRAAGSIQMEIDANNNDTAKYFRVTANGTGASGTELFRVREDGKVVVGDTNSDAQFGVYRDSYNLAEFTNTNADATGAEIYLRKDSSSPADNDTLGLINFIGDNDAGERINYAYIQSKSTDVSDSTEDGELYFSTRGAGTLAERLRIDSSGRLLIGTTKTYGSASYYDDITINNSGGTGQTGGTGITLVSSTDSWASIYLGDSDNHGVGAIKYDHNTNSMRFVVNATDPALIINSSGNIGIGTNNPNHELTVYGDEPHFRMTHTGSTNYLNSFYVNVDGTGVKFTSSQEVTTTRRPFIFEQYTTEVMRIDGSGKVGIGTDNPDTLLHAESNASTGITFEGSSSNTNHITGDAGTYLILKNKSATDNNFSNILGVDAGGQATSQISFISKEQSTNAGILAFGTRVEDGSMAERLRITSYGHLLLGGTLSVNDLTENNAGQKGLVIGSTGMGNAGIAIINSTTGTGRIYFGDAVGSSADRHRGYINYYHNDGSNSDYMMFGTAGAEKLRITSGGVFNFGHGTETNLHGKTTTGVNVNGNGNSGQIIANVDGNRALIIGRQSDYGQVIEFFQGTNTNEAAITIPAADSFGIETAGTERLRITSTGLVGIGTDNPATLLDVWGANGAGQIRFVETNHSTNNRYGKVFEYAGNLYFQSRDDSNDGGFIFRGEDNSNTAEFLRIDSSGRVMMGNTVASSMLGAANRLVVGDGGGNQGMTIYSSSSDAGIIAFADGTSDPHYRRGQIIYDHGGDTMDFRTNGNNIRMQIGSDGWVGVGHTGSNFAFFDVASDSGVVSGSDFTARVLNRTTSGGNGLIIEAGQTDSNTSFRVRNIATSTPAFYVLGGGTVGISSRIEHWGDSDTYFGFGGIFDSVANTVNIVTGGTERLRITSTGAWAIEGSSNYGSSGQVLTSNGNDSPTWQDASGGGFTQDAQGNLVAGTGAGPASDNANTIYNVSIGCNAGASLTTGDCNTFIGHNAGRYSTTNGLSVFIGRSAGMMRTANNDYNIAIGYAAGSCSDKGNSDDNIAIGRLSGKWQDGCNNVSIGMHAGACMTSGHFNVALGQQALIGSATTTSNTGSCNVAIGMYAGCNITSGLGNVFMGQQTGKNFTTGSYNIVFGRAACLSGTATANNTIIMGDYAARCITTANDSIALGVYALGSLGSAALEGDLNIAIGCQAGGCITTGGCSITMGLRAGKGITTGNQNIFLGKYSGMASAGITGSDNVVIGTNAGCSMTSGTTNVFIGKCAGKNATTGSKNIAIGICALHDGVVTGEQNIVMGCDAGGAISSGSYNLLFGRDAARGMTTASNNMAFGTGTLGGDLNAVTTGTGNIVMGNLSAVGATSANYNVVMGHNAARCITTGDYNNVFGAYAAQRNRGSYNFAAGYLALAGTATAADNTGGCNIAIGNYAGYCLSTGYKNVIFGCNAAKCITTGGNNVAVGPGAGKCMTTTSENTFIGGYAGKCITTGTSHTAIGWCAGCGSDDGNDSIFIGRYSGRTVKYTHNSIFIGKGGPGVSPYCSEQSIFIGNNAGLCLSDSCNNIVIGMAHYGAHLVADGAHQLSIGMGANAWLWGNASFQLHTRTIFPQANATYDLGSSALRWANLYTEDLELSNKSKKDTGGNDVDGTWGDWTLQEGETDIFMINNRTGKKFKINMTEVE